MKERINKLKNNTVQILETLILIAAAIAPFVISTKDVFKEYLAQNTLSPDNFVKYIAISHGKYVAAVILVGITILAIRRINASSTMNQRGCYHDYPYCWYWYCAKILGFKKCNLVQVPIHTQFELIIRGVFNEYPLNDADFPEVQGESISVKKANEEYNSKEINLILEDTYPISEKQIPKAKRVLRTTTVSRNDGKSVGRHFSQSFIEAIINAARELPNDCTVNVFATTNPKNTVHIARRAFMLAERGNIAHLYVFQQKKSTKRSFEYKRYKIY